MSATGHSPQPLIICSKSGWYPAIRREHSLAMLAAAEGHKVTFIERAVDVRVLRRAGGMAQFVRGLARASAPVPGIAGISAVPQTTLLPGHLNGPAELTSNFLLRGLLARTPEDAVTVINVPWQWPATASVRGRRVFDCADDWSALMTHRSSRLSDLYERIGREADAIILANRSLAGRFPGERTIIVPNGVSEDMLEPLTPAPGKRRLVQTGTLTPRFDAPLTSALLDLLPEWTLDLYGQCQYPGCQEQPGPELAGLLSRRADRIQWHGALSRESLAAAIDHADVSLVLNRPDRSAGQDSMKLYDYAARGRPIVSTRISADIERIGPPNTKLVNTAAEMAAAVLASQHEPASWALERRRWAEQRRWSTRWPAWSRAVFGSSEATPKPREGLPT
jgi:hypothetical protein